MQRFIVSLLLAITCNVLCGASVSLSYEAVVIAPVVDVAGSSLAYEFKNGTVDSHYQELPFAPDKGFLSCLRMHQLKFNEVVTVTSPVKKNAEVQCDVSNLFYLDHRRKKRKSFWILKKHIMPLTEIEKRIDRALIPAPIDMAKKPKEYNRNVLTLVMPWYDKRKQCWYSAGTRFVRCPEKDTAKTYAFYCINYKAGRAELCTASKKTAVVSYPTSPEKMRALFIKILKSWVHSPQGFIAYVFGGTSFINRYKNDDFALIFTKRDGWKVSYWQRYPDDDKPFAGFDCSGMLLTAAQIAGMPYFLKNTYTITQDCGRPLKKTDNLEPGDLIWYSGHVMVVSSLQKNKIIEAVGYESGYGKVQELELERVFKGIQTFDQLLVAYHHGHSLKRLNNKGEPWKSISKIKILRLV